VNVIQPAHLQAVSASDLFVGEAAIGKLEELCARDQAGASSHWRERLSKFTFSDGRAGGYRGFGSKLLPSSLPYRALGHYVMQRPYRRMGRQLPSFPHFYRVAKSIARLQERVFDYDILRQALTVAGNAAYFSQLAPTDFHAVIGDGFGLLTSILLKGAPRSRVVTVNLAPVLAVDILHIRRSINADSIALATGSAGVAAALDNPSIKCLAICADNWQLLAKIPIGFAYNLVSMGEMNPSTIAQYFNVLRSNPAQQTFFYCANRVEKILPDGTVVRFDEYPWRPGDQVLRDELCPWHQYYYSYFPPRYLEFDGKIIHRLAVLEKSKDRIH